MSYNNIVFVGGQYIPILAITRVSEIIGASTTSSSGFFVNLKDGTQFIVSNNDYKDTNALHLKILNAIEKYYDKFV